MFGCHNYFRTWDAKTIGEAYGLMKLRVTDSTFVAAFQIVLYFVGFTKGLGRKVQGSSIDKVQGYEMVETVRQVLGNTRSDEIIYDTVFERMETMATVAGLESLHLPRHRSRQTQRSSVPAETAQLFFKRAIFIPYLDS